VKLGAKVTDAAGKPLDSADVQVLDPSRVIANGAVKRGVLSVTVEGAMPAVWGLTVGGAPVITFPVTVGADSIELGEIQLVPSGVALPAFHAKQGRVFGAPAALLHFVVTPQRTEPIGAAVRPDAPPLKTEPVLTRAPIDSLKPVPIGVLLDSTAQQFEKATDTTRSVKLTAATMTVRGLPAGSGEDLSLQFPTAELLKTTTSLSELTFGLRASPLPPVKPPVAAGSALPDLSGYTRELALRKLASAGLSGSVASEIVSDVRAVGRVVRQVPKPGQPADPATLVQLFIGKAGGQA